MKPAARQPASVTAPTGGSTGAVSLHIERLIVDGVPLSGGDARRLQESVERELTHLLGRDGLGARHAGSTEHSLTAPAIALSGRARALTLGQRVARSIHAALEPRS